MAELIDVCNIFHVTKCVYKSPFDVINTWKAKKKRKDL